MFIEYQVYYEMSHINHYLSCRIATTTILVKCLEHIQENLLRTE